LTISGTVTVGALELWNGLELGVSRDIFVKIDNIHYYFLLVNGYLIVRLDLESLVNFLQRTVKLTSVHLSQQVSPDDPVVYVVGVLLSSFPNFADGIHVSTSL
jgi:hypothetical protein